MMITKKAFISYSWSGPSHELWVLELAKRLVQDGVDTILDKWDLKEGHDKFAFMESMVHAKDIDKVLIILDKKYTEKADDRSGGVGTETMIISSKVYESTVQEKFIPIVIERDDLGNAYLPVYLKSKIYIDFSAEEHFETSYEQLLRNIFQMPSQTKPKLGSPPKYLLEETPISHKTTTIVRSFEAQIDKSAKRVNPIAKHFFSEFLKDLKDFRLAPGSCNSADFGELLYNNLTKFTPLRNDFISFLEKLAKTESDFDMDILIGFFEQLPAFLNPEQIIGSWYSSDFVNFKFIINELFIYTVAVLLKYENYKMLADVLNSKYFINDRYKGKTSPESYSTFYSNVDEFSEYYKKQHGSDFINTHADFLVKRLPSDMSKEDLVNADLLCFFIAELEDRHWFPRTYIYKDEYSNLFPILTKLLSKRHFEKVKEVFNIEKPEELTLKINALGEKKTAQRGYTNSFSRMPGISNYIDENLIATIK